MKLSKEWETVLERVPNDVRRGARYYALSDLDKVTIIVTGNYVAVHARLEGDLSKDDIQLRDELKERLAEMTGDRNPLHKPVRFAGKPEEEEWNYSVMQLG